MAGVGADFQEGRHGPDELAVRLDDGGAAHVFIQVTGDGPLRLSQGGEVVELHLGPFDGERLCVGWRGQTPIVPSNRLQS
jgi:hypothetical protein